MRVHVHLDLRTRQAGKHPFRRRIALPALAIAVEGDADGQRFRLGILRNHHETRHWTRPRTGDGKGLRDVRRLVTLRQLVRRHVHERRLHRHGGELRERLLPVDVKVNRLLVRRHELVDVRARRTLERERHAVVVVLEPAPVRAGEVRQLRVDVDEARTVDRRLDHDWLLLDNALETMLRDAVVTTPRPLYEQLTSRRHLLIVLDSERELHRLARLVARRRLVRRTVEPELSAAKPVFDGRIHHHRVPSGRHRPEAGQATRGDCRNAATHDQDFSVHRNDYIRFHPFSS